MISVVVVSENKSTIELVNKYIDEFENFNFLFGTSDFSKAYESLKGLGRALVLVDISNYQEQGINFISKISSDFPDCKIAALSDNPQVDIIVRTMRVGACEFIPMPFIKDALFESLSKIYNDFNGSKQKKSKCRIISVYSNKGGVGKTSVATNLALELTKITKENVALIDLNFQMGDVSTFLDIKPSFNISYIFDNIDKVNGDYLLSTMEKYKNSSLYVLADPPYYSFSGNIITKNLIKLFDILRDTFSYVIVDTAAGFEKVSMMALENSDLIFLLTIVNLPALRNCQRCIEIFEKTGIDKDKIQILVNRYMENDEISAEDVEEVLGKNLYWKIPNNYFTMMSAINKGVPVSEINPDSNVALSFKNLALIVSDSVYRQRK